MKAYVIRSKRTGLFYGGFAKWTPATGQALVFLTKEEALSFRKFIFKKRANLKIDSIVI